MGENESDLFLQKVITYPNEVQWKNPHDVQLGRLSDDSLGVVFKTCHVPRVKETWTIVILVKEKCRLLNSCTLECGSRVTKVNGYDVTKSNSTGFLKILKSCKSKKGIITFRVYKPSGLPSVDIHVESQKLLNPLLDHSNSSSVSSVSAVSQSEDIKLESLTKDQRKKGKSQPQLRTSKTAGSHSWYTTQSSNLSLGSDLTPVEAPETPISGGCTESTPLMEFSHVGGPSSLGSDAENIDVGNAALQNPCNIVWQSNTEKITLQKTGREEKVGFYYKIKKTSTDAELYFLVEKVDVGSPSHGKLHLGDWIRSVNGTPITDNKDLLKQEIRKSEREVTLVIQRPESILRPTSGVLNNNNSQNRKSKEIKHVLPEPQLSPAITSSSPGSRKSWREPSNMETRFSDLNVTALDDIKIDGMSVYMGPVQYEPFTEPAIIISDPSDRTVESFITGREIIPTLPARTTVSQIPTVGPTLSSSHRRNNSESSVAVLSKSLTHQTSGPRPTTSASDEEAGDPGASIIADCIKHIARRDLQRRPYVRINQISTSSLPGTNLTNNLLKALGVKASSVSNSNHIFRVHQNELDLVNSSHLKTAQIEDFIIAKHMAESFKCGNMSIKDVGKALISCPNQLLTGSTILIDSFMENPPPLDTDFVEVEIENFVYEDILNFWPSVYFTSNSVYVIVFNYHLFISHREEEIKRLQMCINLIHASSSMTNIFLLCDKHPSGGHLNAVMSALAPLESALKVNNADFSRCSNCGCNKRKVPPDAFSQIQENKHSGQVYFLASRPKDWTEFVQNIREYICCTNSSGFSAGYRFPLLAVLAMKLLKQEESESMATTTMTYFKQNIMQKILPGVSEHEALAALHQSGKLCWHSQVAHRTVHSNAHNMFILLRPLAVKQSVQYIASRTSRNAAHSAHSLTHQQLVSDCLGHLHYKDKDELVMFLELYHVLEAVKSCEPQAEYYVAPRLVQESPSSLSTLVQRYTGKPHRMWFIDFHGLLPVNMCLSLLVRLGETFGGMSQIKSVYTSTFEYQGMSLFVELIPYYGKAVILMTFDQSTTKLSPEGTFHIITSALKKAVSSNLLTYHIGPECEEHVTHQELMALLIRPDFATLAQKVHILDAGEGTMTSGQASWKTTNNIGTNGLSIDTNILLQDMPSSIEECLCKGLNFGGDWRYLFESVGLSDWKMMEQFNRSGNPTKGLLSYLKTASTCTLRDVVKLLQQRQRKDILHDLTVLGLSCNEL